MNASDWKSAEQSLVAASLQTIEALNLVTKLHLVVVPEAKLRRLCSQDIPCGQGREVSEEVDQFEALLADPNGTKISPMMDSMCSVNRHGPWQARSAGANVGRPFKAGSSRHKDPSRRDVRTGPCHTPTPMTKTFASAALPWPGVGRWKWNVAPRRNLCAGKTVG
jgi:hypothetical protein